MTDGNSFDCSVVRERLYPVKMEEFVNLVSIDEGTTVIIQITV